MQGGSMSDGQQDQTLSELLESDRYAYENGIERNSCEGNFHYIRGKAYQKLGEEAEYQNELKWMEMRKYKPNSWDTL
jgi:hypothetical protein